MCSLDVLLQSNSSSSSRVVDVEENDIARQGELFVLYFLQTHDIEILTVDKRSERVQFCRVRDGTDVDRRDVVRRESHL